MNTHSVQVTWRHLKNIKTCRGIYSLGQWLSLHGCGPWRPGADSVRGPRQSQSIFTVARSTASLSDERERSRWRHTALMAIAFFSTRLCSYFQKEDLLKNALNEYKLLISLPPHPGVHVFGKYTYILLWLPWLASWASLYFFFPRNTKTDRKPVVFGRLFLENKWSEAITSRENRTKQNTLSICSQW